MSPAGARAAAGREHQRRVLLEPLEPRYLLSADPVGAAAGAALADGLDLFQDRLEEFIAGEGFLDDRLPLFVQEQVEGESIEVVSPTIRELLTTDVDQNNDGTISGSVENGLLDLEFADEDIPLEGTADLQITIGELLDEFVFKQVEEFFDSADDTPLSEFDDLIETGGIGDDGLEARFQDFFGTFVVPPIEFVAGDASSAASEDALEFGFRIEFTMPGTANFDLGKEAAQDFGFVFPEEDDEISLDASFTLDLNFGVDIPESSDPGTEDFFLRETGFGLEAIADIGGNDIADNDTADNSLDFHVGFLDAGFSHDGDGAAEDQAKIRLDAAVEAELQDPSSPVHIGFDNGQLGAADTSGTVTAANAPDLPLEHDVVFDLRIGNGFLPIAERTEVTVAADSDTDTVAELVADIEAALPAALADLVTVGTVGDRISFSLAADELDPSPLGFAQAELGLLGEIRGDAFPVPSEESPFELGGDVAFLLSVGGAVAQRVQVGSGSFDSRFGLRDQVQTAVDDALGAGEVDVTTELVDGDFRLVLASTPDASGDPRTLEISETLTLDAEFKVTHEELGFDLEDLVDGGPAEDSEAVVNLPVAVDAGIGFQPEGARIHAQFDPFDAATPTDGKRVSLGVDLDPGSRAGEPFIELEGFEELLPFRNLGAGGVIGGLEELRSWLDGVLASDLFSTFDIPFADATLADVFDLGTLLDSQLLFDDGGDGIDGVDNTNTGGDRNDQARLLEVDDEEGSDSLVPTFDTAQDLADRLDDLLGGVLGDDEEIAAAYDPDTQELTYFLRIARDFEAISKDVGLDFDFGPLQGLSVKTDAVDSEDPDLQVVQEPTVELTAEDVGFATTLGFKLDESTPVDLGTTLEEINDGEPVEAGAPAVTGGAAVVTRVGVLEASGSDATATFGIALDGEPDPEEVTLAASETQDNDGIGDLVDDLNDSLAAAGLDGQVQAVADGERRFRLEVIDDTVDSIRVEADRRDLAVTGLGLPSLLQQSRGSDGADPSIAGTAPAVTGRLSGNAEFTVTLDGESDGTTVTVDADRTTENGSILDLVNDVQNSLPGDLRGVIGVTHDGDRLVLTAAGETSGFTVSGTNDIVRDELGLVDATSADATLAANRDDLLIRTRDGSVFGITLDEAVERDDPDDPDTAGTLADIADAIEGQTADVSVGLNDAGTALQLRDGTTGPEDFRILSLNGSDVAGLLGLARAGGLPAGDESPEVIVGDDLDDLELTDRVFLREPEPFTGTISLATPETPEPLGIDASFGLVGVDLQARAGEEPRLEGTASLAFDTSGGDLDLRSLFDALDGGFAGLLGVIDAPTFEGSSDATLGATFDVSLDEGDEGFDAISLGTDPHIVIDFSSSGLGEFTFVDGFEAPVPAVANFNLGELLAFEHLGPTDLLAGLSELAGLLDGLTGIDALDSELPLIQRSVNDMIDLGDRFATALRGFTENPAPSLQALEETLRDAFGLPLDPEASGLNDRLQGAGLLGEDESFDPVALGFDGSGAGDTLRVDLSLPAFFERELGLELDLGEELSGTLLDAIGLGADEAFLQGAAGLSVSAAGVLDLALGLELPTSDEAAPGFTLFEQTLAGADTGLHGALAIGGQDLTFRAGLGKAGFFISGGEVGVEAAFDAVPTPTEFTDGTLDLGAGLPGFEFDRGDTGAIEAGLPVFFPSDSEYVGDIGVTGNLFDDPSNLDVDVPFQGILESFDFDSIGLLDQILLGIDGLDLFLQEIESLAQGEILGVKLPFVGDQLQAANFIEEFRFDFIDGFRTTIEEAPERTVGRVTDFLSGFFGPSGLDILKDAPDGEDGLAVQEGDNFIQFDLLLGKNRQVTAPIDVDFGIPALNIDLDGDLAINLDWELGFGFGFSFQEGFYIALGDEVSFLEPEDPEAPDAEARDELTVDVSAGLLSESEDDPAGLSGRLAFLRVTADDASVQTETPDELQAAFEVDFSNGLDAGDNRIDLSELTALQVGAGLGKIEGADAGARANIELALTAGLGDVAFPEVIGDFRFEWALDANTAFPGGDAFADGLQFVGFENIELDLGSFIGDALGPIFEQIQEVTQPLSPLIDVFTNPIPVISDLAGQPITLADIARVFGTFDPTLIEVLGEVVDVVNGFDFDEAGSLLMPIGEVALFNSDGSDGPGGLGLDTLLDPATDFSSGNDSALFGDALDAAGDFLGDFLSDKSGDVKDGLEGVQGAGDGDLFRFPLLENPARALGLLLGRDVDLVLFDLPAFEAQFSYSQLFPIIGPLGVSITGTVGATFDFAFGYDTFGLRQFAESDFADPGLVFEGFFISDVDLSVDAMEEAGAFGSAPDIDEVVLSASLSAAAELNFGVASAGAGGGLFAEIGFDLFDPDDDGRVRLQELAANIEGQIALGNPGLAPLAIFDISGTIGARLFAFIEILFTKKTFDITPPIEIVNFEIPFERPPVLASEQGDTLLLHMGEFAARRVNGDVSDGDEFFRVESRGDGGVDVSLLENADPESGAIFTQSFDQTPERITGFGGEGADFVDVSGLDSNVWVEFHGGPGDDTVRAGPGSPGRTLLFGDAGDDDLAGGDGEDIILGGRGNDIIRGGGGEDFLFGDLGRVSGGTEALIDRDPDDSALPPSLRELEWRGQVTASDGDDDISGGAGRDVVFGGGGADRIGGDVSPSAGDGGTETDGDILLGDGGELAFPEFGPDELDSDFGGDVDFAGTRTLLRAPDGSGLDDVEIRRSVNALDGADEILGHGGRDRVLGGGGNDRLDGGAQDDFLLGEAGFDTIAGAAGADLVFGGTGSDVIYGFRAGSDADASDGGDTVFAGTGNDIVHGQAGADVLHGSVGSDQIFGDGANDEIHGESGPDFLFGGAGNDEIFGAGANDVIFGDRGIVAFYASDDTLRRTIGKGAVTLLTAADTGLVDDNRLSFDVLVTDMTKTGDDIIDGGEADDIVLGGAGDDRIGGDLPTDADIPGDEIPVGRDVLIGDGGLVHLDQRQFRRVETLVPGGDVGEPGGVDRIFGDDAEDIILGGVAGDFLFGGHGDAGDGEPRGPTVADISDADVIVGDNGRVEFAVLGGEDEPARSVLDRIETTDDSPSTATDTIEGNEDADIVLAGVGPDVVAGNLDDDVLLGDNGVVDFDVGADDSRLVLVRSDAGPGADDIVSGNRGADVIMGGDAGDTLFGDDASASAAALDGADVILGDNGEVTLDDAAGQRLVRSQAIERIVTTDDEEATGGADLIEGNAAADILIGGVNGLDAEDEKGIDRVYGDARSPVAGLDGDDILLGDNGEVAFGLDDGVPDLTTLDLIRTIARSGTLVLGGRDHLFGNAGGDTALGGSDGDLILGDNDESADESGVADVRGALAGRDTLIGDQGRVDREDGLVTRIETTDFAFELLGESENVEGGVDTIQGNDLDDVILGGVDGDLLHGEAELVGDLGVSGLVDTAGDDTLVGDEGRLLYDLAADDPAGEVGGLRVAGDDDPLTLDVVETFATGTLGGDDTIHGNGGDDVAFGGSGGDAILGDLYRGSLAAAETPGEDVLLGDGGRMTFIDGAVTLLRTIEPGEGGADTIQGDDLDDTVMGGFAGDLLHGEAPAGELGLIEAGAGDDVILGDNGRLDWILPDDDILGRRDVRDHLGGTTVELDGAEPDVGTLDRVTTTDPTLGGDDVIYGNGNTGEAAGDVILGGTGSDTVRGDTGDDVAPGADGPDGADLVFGDHAKLYPTLAAADGFFRDNDFFSIDTAAGDLGAADVLFGNASDDILVGGQGDDVAFGGTGDDDLVGGHNIAGSDDPADGEPAHDDLDGLDAAAILALAPAALADLDPADVNELNDILDGGADDDVIAGDNAIVIRQGDDLSPRFRMVGADGLAHRLVSDNVDDLADIDVGFEANVTGDPQPHQDMDLVRSVTLLDHGEAIEEAAVAGPGDPRPFGNDVIAGGGADDELFGQLGDDIQQGDGAIGVISPAKTEGDFDPFDPAQDADPGFDLRNFTIRVDLEAANDTAATLRFGVVETPADGDDYVEGNGGNDRIYGNLGQDDLIGGSSTLFGLSDADAAFHGVAEGVLLRPDGADLIYGGAGNPALLERNASIGGPNNDVSGDTIVPAAERDATDADTILGDNGDVFRLVTGVDSDGDGTIDDVVYERFNYDRDATTANGFVDDGFGTDALTIRPRAVDSSDYGYEYIDHDGDPSTRERLSFTASARGEGDLIYGESGDDVIHGMSGNDVAFGNSGHDDLHGGIGTDFLLGGTGVDGVVGDDGLVLTSRNSDDFGEPLHGIDSLNPDQGEVKKNEEVDTDALNAEISTPGNIQRAVINVEDELVKSVELFAFRTDDLDGGELGAFGDALRFNDIVFGGLGNDFVHAGDGDDAVSGAEALPAYHSGTGFGGFGPVNTFLQDMQDAPPNGTPDLADEPFWFGFAPYNPGDILRFEGKEVVDGTGQDPATRDEFAWYDEFDPRRKLMFDFDFDFEANAGADFCPLPTLDGVENPIDFLLNFDADEGPAGPAFEGDDAPLPTDGADRIFGDPGNDWQVGGSGRDHMYGGRGDDLLNMDDDHDSGAAEGKPNDPPGDPLDNTAADEFQAYADIAYAGAGRDVMLLNTGADRAIDWVGEYNSYIVPFSPFGAFHISRTLQPQVPEFLHALADSDGIDNRVDDDKLNNVVDAQLFVDQKRSDVRTDDPDPVRDGEPYGELGMVRQTDFDWQAQTGAPNDPQPGNFNGQREIMRRELFQDAATTGFAADVGTFTVAGGEMEATPEALDTETVSLFHLDALQPDYMEILVTADADKDKKGWNSNAYVIFDYQGPENFKFAGINPGIDKIQIGHRTPEGWVVDTQTAEKLWDETKYGLTVVLHGSVATVWVNQQSSLSLDFGEPLNDNGMIGLGTDNAVARFDDFQVQKLPPLWTLDETEPFTDAADNPFAPVSGDWQQADGRFEGAPADGAPAVATRFLDVAAFTRLELGATLKTTGQGGLVFDYYGEHDFKFVALDAANDRVLLGHRGAQGFAVDASAELAIEAGADHELTVSLLGTSAAVTVDGEAVLGHVYNALLNDGGVGLLARDGTTGFDSAVVRSDDPVFATDGDALRAVGGASGAGVPSLEGAEIGAVAGEAVSRLGLALGLTDAQRTGLEDVEYRVVDLPGDMLARLRGDAVELDVNAAGHGWFVDATPGDDGEFRRRGGGDGISAVPASAAYGRMDLLTGITHELGHVIGLGHDDAAAFMAAGLEPGVRLAPAFADGKAAPAAAVQETPARLFDEARGAFLAAEEVRWLEALDAGAGGGYAVFGTDDGLEAGDDDGDEPAVPLVLAAADAEDEDVGEAGSEGSGRSDLRSGLGTGLSSLLVDWSARFHDFRA